MSDELAEAERILRSHGALDSAPRLEQAASDVLAELCRLRAATVGVCGNYSPTYRAREGCGLRSLCSLPFGHEGMHYDEATSGRWGKPWTEEPDAPYEALAVLRDLVAYWDATHPDAIDPDMTDGVRVRLVNQGADLRRRIRALVAEHTPNEETP